LKRSEIEYLRDKVTMSNGEALIVQKLWNYCNVLRDESAAGIGAGGRGRRGGGVEVGGQAAVYHPRKAPVPVRAGGAEGRV